MVQKIRYGDVAVNIIYQENVFVFKQCDAFVNTGPISIRGKLAQNIRDVQSVE